MREYVVLSDTESYNTWLEFRRKNETVVVSIVKSEKAQGSHSIEFTLKGIRPGEWRNEEIDFEQLKKEFIKKMERYLNHIIKNNPENLLFNNLERELKEII